MKYDFIGTDKLVINAKIGFGTKFIIVACLFTRLIEARPVSVVPGSRITLPVNFCLLG